VFSAQASIKQEIKNAKYATVIAARVAVASLAQAHFPPVSIHTLQIENPPPFYPFH